MASQKIPQFYSVQQVADLLGVSTKTVRRWTADNLLRVHRMGRQLRFSEEDLRAFVALKRQ